MSEKPRGEMTVSEAGRKGGEKTAETHGEAYYAQIGRIGGQRVKRLIEQGRRLEAAAKGGGR